MKTNIPLNESTQPIAVGITRLLKQIKERIVILFEPEEVEVTFETKGDKTSYHYTVLPRKRVA